MNCQLLLQWCTMNADPPGITFQEQCWLLSLSMNELCQHDYASINIMPHYPRSGMIRTMDICLTLSPGDSGVIWHFLLYKCILSPMFEHRVCTCVVTENWIWQASLEACHKLFSFCSSSTLAQWHRMYKFWRRTEYSECVRTSFSDQLMLKHSLIL